MKVIHPVIDDFRIVIEFNRREAEALRDICGRIGENASTTRRSVFDDLATILDQQGVKRICKVDGEIMFSSD